MWLVRLLGISNRAERERKTHFRIVGDYEISGNAMVAIAINRNNPRDSTYFTIDPGVNNNAFIRACGWAYEPED